MSNQGYDTVLASWQGLFVPMGTLRPAVERRHRVGQAAMKNPMVVKPLSDGGVGIVTSKSPEDFTAFLKRRNDRFARAITGGKIQAEQEVVS
jgi:tripartite-type tricarboxylate transporter receptor subunit TctC